MTIARTSDNGDGSGHSDSANNQKPKTPQTKEQKKKPVAKEDLSSAAKNLALLRQRKKVFLSIIFATTS
jgi:hypothetical protein